MYTKFYNIVKVVSQACAMCCFSLYKRCNDEFQPSHRLTCYEQIHTEQVVRCPRKAWSVLRAERKRPVVGHGM